MAYELSEAYSGLYGAQKEELMEILRKLTEQRGVSYGARGVSGRARAETESADIQDLLSKLGIIKGGLGAQQLGREQQVADVAGARAYETKMTCLLYTSDAADE